jgi:acetolactate synthase-1/2/3 large subunit
MIRVCDYIAQFIRTELNVDTIFTLTGGGAMFLNDAFACQDKIRVVCNHHEQAAAMAASGYARRRNSYGVAVVTTGCGGTNTITGLLGAWQDSIPLFIISGQSKRQDTIQHSGLPLRQVGVQEADIITIVKSLCKYAVMLDDPREVKYHLQKAASLALSGRPGPVWIDVPLDVQATEINPEELRSYTPEHIEKPRPTPSDISDVRSLLMQSSRPVIIAGNGVRLSGAIPALNAILNKFSIPAVFPYMGADLVDSDSDYHIGRIGAKGTRAGNFAVQNSDLVIAIGTRLDISAIGYDGKNFARNAKILIVDIDPVEHQKQSLRKDKFIHSDARTFCEQLLAISLEKDYTSWLNKTKSWKIAWPACLPEYTKDSPEGINLYYTIDYVTRNMPEGATAISDAGSAFYVASQAGFFNRGKRYVTSGAQAEMGYTLPASIGAAAATPSIPVFGFTGDGSFQLNLQELQTLKETRLPVKLFILNNDGYLSIRSTQRRFFQNRLIGTDSTCGVSFPSIEKLAHAYGLPYVRIEKVSQFKSAFEQIQQINGPVICEVISIRDQEIIPCLTTQKLPDGRLVSKPLEDMYPFLPRDIFHKEMIIKPLSE